MVILYSTIGVALLLLVTIDVCWTTLWVDGGAGPISSLLSGYLWKVMKRVSRNHPRILSLGGPFILVATLLAWIMMVWAGWLLFFSGNDYSVIDTRDDVTVGWVERIYFTGYVIFTLGIGDYVPQEGFWQLATAVASGSGFLFLTLSATYTLSILGAITQQRSFASSITGIGKSGNEVVKNAWNGKDFHDMDLLLNSTSSQLSMLAAKHKAYPILYYYHSSQAERASSFAVAVLDEALTILTLGIPERYQPNTLLVKGAQSSISDYLETLSPRIMETDVGVPPVADLKSLQAAGLPTKSDEEFKVAVNQRQERRKRLLQTLKSDARPWPSGENASQ